MVLDEEGFRQVGGPAKVVVFFGDLLVFGAQHAAALRPSLGNWVIQNEAGFSLV